MKSHELKGQVFGKLVALRRVASTRSGMTRWECVCECGNITAASTKHLLAGRTKSCGCSRVKRGPDHAQWTGVGELSGDHWSNIIAHSLSRVKIEVTIDKNYAWALFISQGKRCALTGVSLYFGANFKGTASLDRIDSGKGYIPGNVQWVHKDVNRMKNIYSQEYFIEVCKNVARTHV